MTHIVAITSNFQIHIPKSVRKQIGLTKPGQAKLEVKDKSVIITPQESPFLKSMGKYAHIKPVKPIDLDNVRDYVDWTKV